MHQKQHQQNMKIIKKSIIHKYVCVRERDVEKCEENEWKKVMIRVPYV
jgi:hypothetical protein